eukprot:525398_1
MTDTQTIYDNYVSKFGYAPKQTQHLVAYAKKCGTPIKYAQARKTMAKNYVMSPDIAQTYPLSYKDITNPKQSANSNKKKVTINPLVSENISIKSPKGNNISRRNRSRSDADSIVKSPNSNRDSRNRQRSYTNQTQRPMSSKSMTPQARSKKTKNGISNAFPFTASNDDLHFDDEYKSFSKQQRSSIKPMKIKSKILNKSLINQCYKNLDHSYSIDRKQILNNYKLFNKALAEKEMRLLKELQVIYTKKKDFLEGKQNELKKKSKQQMSFDPNISLVLDKEQALEQIDGFGYVEFGEDFGDEESNARLAKSKKQKKILKKLQDETMWKLNAIIRMEEELKRKRSDAIRLRQEVEKDLKLVEDKQKTIKQKIDEAKPLIEKARLAVSNISKEELNEIKSLKSPPLIIELAMTAVAMILGNEVKSWRDVQKILSYKFKPNVIKFDGKNMNRHLRNKVETEYQSKDEFNYDRVNEGSKVCGCMVLWVNSQVNYSKALDDVVVMEAEVKKLKRGTKQKLKLANQYEQIVKELTVSIEKYEQECQQMVGNIIKDTKRELDAHSKKLNPINSKFFNMLNIC